MERRPIVSNAEFRRPPARPRSRAPLLVLCVLLVAIVAGFVIFLRHNPIETISQAFVPSPQQVFHKQNLLVLVEGLDYDYTANDQPFSTNSRSDVIWVVNFSFPTRQVYELSVPRDMLATFPGGAREKINQAQAEGGPKEAQQVIAGFLGIPSFDRYAVLRITGAREIIDALGGVDVNVENSDCLTTPHHCVNGPIDYDDTWGHLHVHLRPGMQHLTGAQAVEYARFRHDWCSDPCRIMRQQQVTRALIDKMKRNKIATLLQLPHLVSIVQSNLQTNLTQAEILSIASYYQGVSARDFHAAQAPYTGDVEMSDGDDLVPDQAGIARLVRTMLLAPPQAVASPNPVAVAAIAPASVRVDVENGSGVNGAAHRLADRLKKAGFQIGTIGDATNDVDTSEIHEHSSVQNAGARVRAALPPSWRSVDITSDTDSTVKSDVTIIVGRDLAQPAGTIPGP